MKRINLILLFIILLLPLSIKALSEEEAREALTDYANYIYNNKKDEIIYVEPSEVDQQKIFKGYYTQDNKYAMDCNAFMGFLIYNAFQLQTNQDGNIPQPTKGDGVLTYSGRPALNGNDGWSTHSSFYSSRSYALQTGETIQSATYRLDLQSKLKPGDLIGVVGFGDSHYNSQEEAKKSTHIMMYLGDGKFIHHRSSGVSINSLNEISFGSRVGALFPDNKGNMGPHGAITIMTLQNYNSIPSSVLNNYRYPDGKGNLVIVKDGDTNQANSNKPNNNTTYKDGHYEEVTGLHFCEREDTSKLVLILNVFFVLVRILVPIIVIISIIISLNQVIIGQEKMNEVLKTSARRIIAGLIAILIPTLISKVMEITKANVSFEQCVEMAHHPKPTKKWVEDKNEVPTEEINNTTSNELGINKQGTLITISDKNITNYYFSNQKENLKANDNKWIKTNQNKTEFILLPGKYYAYTKDKNNEIKEQEINISTKDIIITNNVTDIQLLTTDIGAFLKQKDSSLEELNNIIDRSVQIAGINSKDGAAAAALALTQTLYIKYKIKIPYGNTHGTHLTEGVPPSWGSSDVSDNEKRQNFLNQGTHCGGFVSWAYTQAGFEMNSGIGSSKQICEWGYGIYRSLSNNNQVQIGDIMTSASSCNDSKHVSILVAKDSNGYFITESNASIKTIDGTRVLTDNIGIVTSYDRFGSRWSSYLDMSPTITSRKK